jgi:histidinol-phosphate aminotransferase
MKAFWSRIARELSPYVPGEQPRIANLVKLNTNESPFGPSPLALERCHAQSSSASAPTLLGPDQRSDPPRARRGD